MNLIVVGGEDMSPTSFFLRDNIMLVHTVRAAWRAIRTAIATIDWPTATNTYDPPGDVTERFVAYMLDTLEAEILPINLSKAETALNNLELRAHFNNNAGTATMQIFAAREGETTVRLIAEVAWTAGTQKTAVSSSRYFAKTATITQYWGKTISVTPEESGTGIAVVSFDTLGYNRFWVGFDAISSSDNVTIEYSGF